MGRPYSDDLRGRVLKEAKRSSARRAAVRFGINAATAARVRLGERSAHPWGGRRGRRLDAHVEFVETMIQDRKGITLDEMVERLIKYSALRRVHCGL